MSILLGPTRGISVKSFIPWTGVPQFEIDLDPDLPVVPSGPLPLVIGLNLPVLGTIDSKQTGKFGPKMKATLVGGGGGWDKDVLALHLSNPSGTLVSSAVLAVTGAEVGEIVTDVTPLPLGTDYVRSAGAASRVLAERDWHVDLLTGITMVAPRIPLPTDPTTIEILTWDPILRVAEVASDMMLQPGMILVDPIRIGLPIMIRDVQQEWSPAGARATCWCVPLLDRPKMGEGAAKLLAAVQSAAREAAPPEFLTVHRYRVAAENPATGKRTLQAVEILGPLPNLIEIGTWTLPGFSAKVIPGFTEVLVGFIGGDPTKPYVAGFVEGIPPLEFKIEALRIALGTIAIEPVAKAPAVLVALAALQTQFAALATFLSANILTSFAAAGMTTTAPALVTAIGTGATAATAQAALIPSPKTFTD